MMRGRLDEMNTGVTNESESVSSSESSLVYAERHSEGRTGHERQRL